MDFSTCKPPTSALYYYNYVISRIKMDSFIRQLRWLFSPRDKYRFMVISLLMAFSALLELAGIGILLGAATLFLSPESSSGRKIAVFMEELLPLLPPEYRIVGAICLIGVLLAAKNILAFFIIRIQAKFIFAKRQETAARLFERYLYADYESFSSLSQEYCFNSFQRVFDLTHMVLMPLMQSLADILVILILTLAAVIIFPAVSLAGIAFMVFCAAAVSLLTRKLNRKYGRAFLQAHLTENQWRHTGIAGEKTIKCTVTEKFFLKNFTTAYQQMNTLSRKLYTLGQIPRLALESASILLAGGVFAVMILLDIPRNEIMLTFAVLTAVIGRILPALSRCHYNLTLIRQNRPLLDDVCRILKELPEEPAADPAVPGADAGKTIELKNISFAYGKGDLILDNFNLTIEPKSSLAIAGRSGKGKCTLIDLLTGLLKPHSGTITAGNIPVSNDLHSWRKQIGIVPQNIFLIDGTVAENVAFGEENIDFDKVKRSLDLAGLPDFAPGYLLTANGNLSGGQRQRIGIARALYSDAKMLIFDEATSALDAETENAFCHLIDRLKNQLTIIIISHRESTLDVCDQKIIL